MYIKCVQCRNNQKLFFPRFTIVCNSNRLTPMIYTIYNCVQCKWIKPHDLHDLQLCAMQMDQTPMLEPIYNCVQCKSFEPYDLHDLQLCTMRMDQTQSKARRGELHHQFQFHWCQKQRTARLLIQSIPYVLYPISYGFVQGGIQIVNSLLYAVLLTLPMPTVKALWCWHEEELP